MNSKLAKKATVQKGKIRVVTAADEIAMWNQRCQPAAGEAEGATGIFNTTVLMPSEVANMPKAAKIYQITGIASGVSIEGLVTDSFTATSMEPNVNIKMKVKDFTLTHLDKSKLELY